MYIGKTPTVGAFQKCDALTASATADYTLQVGSANVSPESVNHMIVSLNGVIQAPTTAYTVAGSTLSFASALTSADSIDFVILLGNVLDIGTPSDNTVAIAKIQDDAVTLAKMAAGTDGNIISYDASGNPVAIATGNDGQVLTSAGAGQPPAFEAAAGGKIQQVVQTYKTDVTTQSAGAYGTYYDISGMSRTITPTKASSKILIQFVCVVGQTNNYGSLKAQGDIAGGGYADIGLADAAGSRTRGWIGSLYMGSDGSRAQPFCHSYLWTPSYTLTDVITVKLLWSNAGINVLNRSWATTDNAGHFVGTSSLTLWEIN